MATFYDTTKTRLDNVSENLAEVKLRANENQTAVATIVDKMGALEKDRKASDEKASEALARVQADLAAKIEAMRKELAEAREELKKLRESQRQATTGGTAQGATR